MQAFSDNMESFLAHTGMLCLVQHVQQQCRRCKLQQALSAKRKRSAGTHMRPNSVGSTTSSSSAAPSSSAAGAASLAALKPRPPPPPAAPLPPKPRPAPAPLPAPSPRLASPGSGALALPSPAPGAGTPNPVLGCAPCARAPESTYTSPDLCMLRRFEHGSESEAYLCTHDCPREVAVPSSAQLLT